MPPSRSSTDIATHTATADARTPSAARRSSESSTRPTVPGAPPSFSQRQSIETNPGASRRRVPSPEIAPPASALAETPEARAARKEGVHAAVSGYFMRHATDGEDSNRAALEALVEDRVAQLVEMGESRESIEATFAKARMHDIGAEGARGFVGSIPFGVASRLLDTKPAIGDTVVAGLNALPGIKDAPDAFKGGLAGGLVSGVADHVGSEALKPAMKNLQWLSASAEELEESMAAAKARADAGMLRSIGQNAAAIQTFTARNVIRGIVGPAVTAAGHAAAATQTDSWMAAIGSPLAGAGFNLVNRHFAEKDHRIGPEYLLGRTDWKEQYQALQKATWKGAAANGAGRVAKTLVNTVDATLSAPRTLFSATSLATNVGALGFGLGAASLATASAGALAKKMGASEGGVVAAEHAARTLSSAAVFASWTTAGIVAEPAVDALRGVSKSAGDLAQQGVSAAVRKSAETIGEGAEAGANYAAPRLRTARDATVRAGEATAETVITSLGNFTTATGNAISNASSAVSARVSGVVDRTRGTLADMRWRGRPEPAQDSAQNSPGIGLQDIARGGTEV